MEYKLKRKIMIKGNELRLGNWVLLHGKYYQVEDCGDGEVVDPIPLTEEILLKCEGCDWHSTKWYIVTIGSITISVNTKTKTTTITDDYTDEVMLNIKCEYLHQLQNIVHSLTHEELNIELEEKN